MFNEVCNHNLLFVVVKTLCTFINWDLCASQEFLSVSFFFLLSLSPTISLRLTFSLSLSLSLSLSSSIILSTSL